MRNKGIITTLTIIVTVLCTYYLSFTLISRSVQQDAKAYARDENGEVNPEKKQRYLDSVWHKPVFNIFGAEFTYEEIKSSEISLGLDLQGGMHVTLEVPPAEIIRGMSRNNQDSAFLRALHRAEIQARTSQQSFTSLFSAAYREESGGKRLAPLFAARNSGGGISLNDSDADVIRVLDQAINEAVSRSYTILSKRIDRFGTSSPNIQRLPGRNQIQVQIPGAENPQRVRKLLSGVARLEFWDVVELGAVYDNLLAINDMLVKEQRAAKAKQQPKEETESADAPVEADTLSALERQLQAVRDSANAASNLDSLQLLNTSPLFALRDPSYGFGLRYSLKDTSVINDIFSRPDVRAKLPRNVDVFWAAKTSRVSRNLTEEPRLELYFLNVGRNRTPRLDGEAIVRASQSLDEKAQPAVSMTMNAKGTQVWAEWTREAAQNGTRIAIVLDELVYSAPTVQSEIPYGSSIIQGSFTMDEAKDLANILQAGSLPATPRIVEEAVIGPTLGQESIQNGLISIVVGFLVIILFMYVTYNNAGWVADAAVVLNLFFLMGVLASLNAALTLPGIAGVLLSLAIAVDANVLINERVKEDLNDGKPIQMAIANGYKNAFSAIIDSNVTTLIKGIVLLLFGTGLIFGFAVTLVIGIVCSLFTSVLFTRLLFERATRSGKPISFSWAWSKNVFRNININFIGQRKFYYTISGAVIIAGMVSLAIKGFNYGVDFKGGRTYIVGVNSSVDAESLRDALEESFGTAPEVKTFGFNNKYQITTGYLIDDPTEEATEDAEQKLRQGLAKVDSNAELLSSTNVGPTVAADTRMSAIYALAIAMVLMFLYILMRFRKWQFAFGTMVSLVHTVLVVVSVFTLLEGVMPFALEIDQAFVAAILTVIGYSINDSVVVFDRVRDFLRTMRAGEHMPTVINNALNDTLSRTLITGMSTIFVIIILFTFGGETIKGFTFAMLVGVLVGTYSSLCIGTPVLVDFAAGRADAKIQPTPAKA